MYRKFSEWIRGPHVRAENRNTLGGKHRHQSSRLWVRQWFVRSDIKSTCDDRKKKRHTRLHQKERSLCFKGHHQESEDRTHRSGENFHKLAHGLSLSLCCVSLITLTPRILAHVCWPPVHALGEISFALLKAGLFGFYCCKSSFIFYIQVLIRDQSPEDFMVWVLWMNSIFLSHLTVPTLTFSP